MTDELQISVRLEDEPDIVYPDSDEDVPEVDGLQMEPAYSEVQQALIARFGSRNDVLVAGNCFIYYKNHGYPERTWLDCFVAFGVDRDAVGSRGCYYTWKTGKGPDFVLEICTAMRALGADLESTRHLYRALGITEYWIFDARGAGRGDRGLHGNRLVDGRYEEMALAAEAAGGVRDTARRWASTWCSTMAGCGSMIRLPEAARSTWPRSGRRVSPSRPRIDSCESDCGTCSRKSQPPA